jgi:hypothetical protein
MASVSGPWVGGTGWGHGVGARVCDELDEGRTRAGCSAWALAVAITAATSGACTGDQDGMQPDAATPRAAAETMDGGHQCHAKKTQRRQVCASFGRAKHLSSKHLDCLARERKRAFSSTPRGERLCALRAPVLARQSREKLGQGRPGEGRLWAPDPENSRGDWPCARLELHLTRSSARQFLGIVPATQAHVGIAPRTRAPSQPPAAVRVAHFRPRPPRACSASHDFPGMRP